MIENELYAEATARWLDMNEAQRVIETLDDTEIRASLQKAENARKVKFWIYAIVMSVMSYLVISHAASGRSTVTVNGVERITNAFDGAFMAGFVWLFLTAFLFAAFKGKAENAAKNVILSKFLNLLAPNSKFSAGDEHEFDFTHLVHKGFLSGYDRVDAKEDSFEFAYAKDGKSIKVNGLEVRTSEMRGSWKNRRRVTTNHCFLIKGEYPETKFKIDKPVRIAADVADSSAFKILSFVIPAAIGPLMALWDDGVVTLFFAQFPSPLMAGIVVWAAIWTVTYFIANWAVNRHRVKLENVDFEKIFDVKCEDQVMSRMILNPAFMDRLVAFVKKTGGKYEFLFENETLYVKKNLNWGFLEINPMKNISSNSKMFIRWYAELKEVTSLITDTGVLVFSRTDYVAATKEALPKEGEKVGLPEINPLASVLPKIPE